jgi:filamentous hemagglutinin family protein
VLDGSFGTSGALTGPNYTIGASMGLTRGNNLFHSFSQFNLAQGDVANFTGPANIQNILARVTGGGPSSINGTIQSSITGANLFLINPHGMMFGANASINVSGSFAAATANYLKLADGARFVAALGADDSALSTAPVSAFGFLGNNPGTISVQQSTLQVPAGQTISLVGGNITLDGAVIQSPGGQINVASVQSAGEIPVNPDSLSASGFASAFPQAGQIQMQNSAQLDASGDGGGQIVIRGGSLTVDNSQIVANTTGSGNGRGIDVAVSGSLDLLNGGQITSISTQGLGNGGNINVDAGSITLNGGGVVDNSGNPSTEISTATGDFFNGGGSGNGGNITIQTGNLTIEDSAQISAATFGAGNAGNVEINASSIKLDAQLTTIAQISTSTENPFGTGGNAGNIIINTGGLQMFNGAELFASSICSGQAGQIDVTANTINLNSGSIVEAAAFGSGNGGDIQVTAKLLQIDGKETLGSGPDFLTGVQAVTTTTAPGGNIQINAGSLEIDHDGSIFTSSLFDIGPGGNIQVTAGNLTLGHGSSIQAQGLSGGNAGTVSVNSANNILLSGNSSISTSAPGSSGGDINVTAGSNIRLIRSQIAANAGLNGGNITISAPKQISLLNSSFNARADSTGSGFGNGGNLTIDPSFLILNESSLISSSSFGNGGNISILSDFFFQSGALIDASAPFGIPGTVSVTAPKIDLSGSLSALPANLLDAEAQLRPDCAVRLAGDVSTFVVVGRGGLPLLPGGFVPSTAVSPHAEEK